VDELARGLFDSLKGVITTDGLSEVGSEHNTYLPRSHILQEYEKSETSDAIVLWMPMDATEVSRNCLTKQAIRLGVDRGGSAIPNHIYPWLNLVVTLLLTPHNTSSAGRSKGTSTVSCITENRVCIS
jgi:hypothetical protein